MKIYNSKQFLSSTLKKNKKNTKLQHHTGLLLNCYVKQKKIAELEEFLDKMKRGQSTDLNNELFDIETAIKVCRESKKYKIALDLARQKNKHDSYLDILISDQNSFDEAIEYI